VPDFNQTGRKDMYLFESSNIKTHLSQKKSENVEKSSEDDVFDGIKRRKFVNQIF